MAFERPGPTWPQHNRSGYRYIDRNTLRAKLLAAFNEQSATRAICDVALYRGEAGTWRIGHVRLTDGSETCRSTVADIEATFRKAYRLLAD